jgi:non-specific serine/threonine protein kinase/serine/threonine-protein kinase
MDGERFQRLARVFEEARGLSPPERSRLLDAACGDDAALRREAQALLEAHDAPGGIPAGAAGVAAPIGAESLRRDLEAAAEPPRGDGGAEIPRRLSHYRVIRKLGEGGMGVVYEAEQENPRRRVAIKVIKSRLGSAEARARFAYEAQVLGLLHHPGIAQIHEAGAAETEDGDLLYFVMEYVDGLPLTAHARSRDLGRKERLLIMARVCDAIHHAHEKGIVHRDLKPGNILVTRGGEPKILDFGVARAVGPDAEPGPQATRTGQIIGTLAYMSPEQASGEKDVDTRSDIYSLGVILYELLSGSMPYAIEERPLYEAVRAIREEEPRRLSTVHRALRGDLETIAGKALEKEKGRRYPSAAALAEDIRRHLRNEPIAAHPPSTLYQLRKFARRNPALVGGLALFVATLAAGTAVSTTLAVRATREATRANKVVDLLRGMFESADPQVAVKGPDYTVRQVLDDFCLTLTEELAGEPEVEAALRETVGRAYRGLGGHEKALEQLARARDLYAASFGAEDHRTIDAEVSIAAVHYHAGRLDEAAAILERVLGVQERLGAPDDRKANALFTLAQTYRGLGRIAEAEDLLQRIIAISERGKGLDRLAARAAGVLALIQRQRGALREADAILTRVHEKFLRLSGPRHPDTLTAMHNLAMLRRDMGRFEEAVEWMRKANAGRRETLGSDHPHVWVGTAHLGTIHLLAGDLGEAGRLLGESLPRLEATLGERNPQTIDCIHDLGVVRAREGRPAEAEPLLRRALDLSRETLGPAHSNTLTAVYTLADVCEAAGRHAEGERLCREWLAARGDPPAEDRRDYHDVWSLLGLCLLGQGKHAEAEPLLVRSHVFFIGREGPEGGPTRKLRQALERLYRDTGRPEMAAALEPTPPARPRPRALRAGAGLEALAPVLEAEPYAHPVPEVTHRSSRWEVRRDGDDFDLTPAFDAVSEKSLSSIRLPRGLLLPATRYFWRVRHTGSNLRESEPSEEGTFVTPGAAFEAAPIDLSAVFNRDVVADPGDPESDAFDGEPGNRLIAGGFDGERDGSPAARGLPAERRVGVHVLGGYGGPNAFQLAAPGGGGDLRVSVPPGAYAALRFLVAGANGGSVLPFAVEYEDGTAADHSLPCPDWFADGVPERDGIALTPVWNGMDRLGPGGLDERNDAALFEAVVELSGGKTLRALILRPAGARFQRPQGLFHLFAATAVRAGPPGGADSTADR